MGGAFENSVGTPLNIACTPGIGAVAANSSSAFNAQTVIEMVFSDTLRTSVRRLQLSRRLIEGKPDSVGRWPHSDIVLLFLNFPGIIRLGGYTIFLKSWEGII
jgi:hypothetical protein